MQKNDFDKESKQEEWKPVTTKRKVLDGEWKLADKSRVKSRKRKREDTFAVEDSDGWQISRRQRRSKDGDVPCVQDAEAVVQALTRGMSQKNDTGREDIDLGKFPNTILGEQTAPLPPIKEIGRIYVMLLLPEAVLNRFSVQQMLLETHMKISFDDEISDDFKKVPRIGVARTYPTYVAEELSKDSVIVNTDPMMDDISQFIPHVLKAFLRKYFFVYNLMQGEAENELQLTMVSDSYDGFSEYDEAALVALYKQNHIVISNRLQQKAKQYYLPPRFEKGKWASEKWSILYVVCCPGDTRVEKKSALANLPLGMAPPKCEMETDFVFLG